MPSIRYRHISPMRVADLGPSGFAPWANVVSTSAPHQQTQQPSIGPMMGQCLKALLSLIGPMLVPHQLAIGRVISLMIRSCPLLHHWPDAASTSANSSAQYQPDDGLMPCFASVGPLLDLHRQLNSPASAQS